MHPYVREGFKKIFGGDIPTQSDGEGKGDVTVKGRGGR